LLVQEVLNFCRLVIAVHSQIWEVLNFLSWRIFYPIFISLDPTQYFFQFFLWCWYFEKWLNLRFNSFSFVWCWLYKDNI
jgi:hypothetical protein